MDIQMANMDVQDKQDISEMRNPLILSCKSYISMFEFLFSPKLLIRHFKFFRKTSVI
jgi:hypothetical protein